MPIDPVCKRHVEITNAIASVDHGAETLYFDTLDCYRKFIKDPEWHIQHMTDEELKAA